MNGPPPATINGAAVKKYVDLKGRAPTGNTQHIVGGQIVPTFAALVIASYEEDDSVYLYYCDEQWREVTDTWHQSVEDATKQAEFEFGPLCFFDR